MTRITFDPYIPLALWAPLALATAALLGWYALASRRRLPARRWWTVVVLMAVAAAVPLVVLLNPTWLEQIPPPAGKPLLTLLVDRSASMATRDAPSGQTRYQAAVGFAAAAAGDLKDDTRFASESSPTRRRRPRWRVFPSKSRMARRPIWRPPCKMHWKTTGRKARRCCC